ncbi:TPA: site-specific DNA-methyltransferase [Neisseria meningitidis]|uniref:site-specific DNA-methyltransferase n=1 Tax=Neisseria meningitidis TaxID=487 RepID=UPI0009AB3E02|nr:site-specific DNA-methyltransferase [Neisseria meningitidis]MBW3988775.1 site-specific DNA-methyltransferase [Neisseria meningitidis]MCL4988796.1 site-specific DNA-methyltransferase [Neisseria meningitidis]MCL6081834.1 site-specific DNA-methyltransferase [Neisseria meningitidis]PKT97045.1 site-specific DNA-methyltransferase [Neisseria meningitidis]PKU06098.1 site-specific DNA-methyltransferase [Neisseria meningitidis]
MIDGRRNYGNRTEPNRTEIIHDLENNFKQNNILKLKQLFPEVFCEDQIDFEKLKLVLGAENLAGAGERYQLDWAGKTAAYLNLQSPTSRTLVPCKEESANFDGTQNVFIEAENLEALKILQKAYAGSVKMIYIDPPYNTGSDSFIYPDKFSESRDEYARRVGDTDDAGYLKRDGVFQGAWRKNGKDSGHYHSNWLSMMLPRLHLAKTLLREDGVIFISIDDNEQAQLKLLCDEVFGAENFVNQIAVKMSELSGVKMKHLNQYAKLKEFLLIYAKNIHFANFNIEKKRKSPETLSKYLKYYSSIIENIESECEQWKIISLDEYFKDKNIILDREKLNDWKLSNAQRLVYRTNSKTVDKFLLKNPNAPDICKLINDDGKEIIKWGNKEMLFLEKYIDEYLGDIWLDISTINLNKETHTLVFENGQKPLTLIKRLLKSLETENNIVMDFFSGSGTTAHAVMQLNAEDGGNRRFICVQLPEETDEKSEARKAGFDTIAEIAKERIRRAGRQISDGLQDGSETDTGFKVFKLAESGFKQWRQPEQSDTEALQRELSLNIDSVLSETSSENLLYELMLRMGLKLTCKVSFLDDVYFVEDEDTGGLYAFLLKRVDQGLIDAVLAKHPAKVAALDRLFEGDDALKSNTVLQMKDAGVMFECV